MTSTCLPTTICSRHQILSNIRYSSSCIHVCITIRVVQIGPVMLIIAPIFNNAFIKLWNFRVRLKRYLISCNYPSHWPIKKTPINRSCIRSMSQCSFVRLFLVKIYGDIIFFLFVYAMVSCFLMRIYRILSRINLVWGVKCTVVKLCFEIQNIHDNYLEI